LTIKLTPHITFEKYSSLALFAFKPSSTVTRNRANLCCYPSDIQLSKNFLKCSRLSPQPSANDASSLRMNGIGCRLRIGLDFHRSDGGPG